VSAAALRAPASTDAVARHYLRLLASEHGVPTLLLTLALVLFTSINVTGFAGLVLPLALAFFLPLYQWRDGPVAVLDDAMPLDRARHRRIRVACGAVWAALALALCVGLYTALQAPWLSGLGRSSGHAGYPAWYPPLLLGWGVVAYLFGAATWLRAERPGRVLTLVFMAATTLAEWIPGPWTGAVAGFATPRDLARAPGWAWGAACAGALALGCAAVWVAASPGLRLPRLALPWVRNRGEATMDTRAPKPVPPGLRPGQHYGDALFS